MKRALPPLYLAEPPAPDGRLKVNLPVAGSASMLEGLVRAMARRAAASPQIGLSDPSSRTNDDAQRDL